MGRKLVVTFCLTVLVLTGIAIVGVRMAPKTPLLRKGMTFDEAYDAMGHPISAPNGGLLATNGLYGSHIYYPCPDWLGNQEVITIEFDSNHKVESWEITPRERTRPEWLSRILQLVDW